MCVQDVAKNVISGDGYCENFKFFKNVKNEITFFEKKFFFHVLKKVKYFSILYVKSRNMWPM